MRRRLVIAVAALFALAGLAGGAFALAGGGGLIFDDGVLVQPGSLDDGKQLLPQTSLTLQQAVARAQAAASGPLGQVDLERSGSRVVYSVDVGDREVRIDAGDGSLVSIEPQD